MLSDPIDTCVFTVPGDDGEVLLPGQPQMFLIDKPDGNVAMTTVMAVR